MQVPTCRHIKTNGLQCKSPSLNQHTYCYFHTRLHHHHTAFRPTAATRGYLIPGQHIELTALEDRESVQIALSVVVNALATGQIDTKRATAILYGLQLASSNAAHLHLKPYGPNIVRTVESSPEGLDLAEPGTLLDLTPYDPSEEDDDEDDEEEEEEEETDDENEEDEEPIRHRQESPLMRNSPSTV